MLQAMLDANICIRVMRDRPASARQRFKAEADTLAISTIVYNELLFGAERSVRPIDKRRDVEEFASHLTLIDFDDAASAHAAQIRAALTASGQIIGPIDLLIAGHARSLGIMLITNNLREFQRVEGLRCEDWL